MLENEPVEVEQSVTPDQARLKQTIEKLKQSGFRIHNVRSMNIVISGPSSLFESFFQTEITTGEDQEKSDVDMSALLNRKVESHPGVPERSRGGVEAEPGLVDHDGNPFGA
jgi:subtilase family serine protease